MDYFIAIVTGIISSIIAYWVTKRIEASNQEDFTEYKSIAFYASFVSLAASLIALAGLVLSVISLWLNGKRLKDSKTKAFKIAFFISIVALIISSINGGISGFYYWYLPNEDDVVILNTSPKDKAILRVNNVNRTSSNLAPSSPMYWQPAVTAAINDTVAFGIYYHNTGSRKTKDLHIRFHYNQIGNSLACGAAESEEYSNKVYLGYSAVQIEGYEQLIPIYLEYVGLYWYPDQRAGDVQLPFGQTGKEIMTLDGVNIGKINSGWMHQGGLTLRAIVRQGRPG